MLKLFYFPCAMYFAPPDDGAGGGDQTTGTGAGDQTGDKGARDKGKAGTDQTGTNQITLEEALAQLAKVKADHDHLLTVHTEMKTKAEKQARAEEEAKKKALAEQGKYKELYESNHNELEKLKPRVEILESTLKAYYDAEIATLPDNLKKLITETDPVEKKLEAITKLKDAGLLTAKKTPGDGSPPPKGGAKKSLADYYK